MMIHSLDGLKDFIRNHIKKLKNSRLLDTYHRHCDQTELTEEWFEEVSEAFVQRDARFLSKHLVSSELWLRVTKEAICTYANCNGMRAPTTRITGREMKRVISYLTGIPERVLTLCVEENRAEGKLTKCVRSISSERESESWILSYIKSLVPKGNNPKLITQDNTLAYIETEEGERSSLFLSRFQGACIYYIKYREIHDEVEAYLRNPIDQSTRLHLENKYAPFN